MTLFPESFSFWGVFGPVGFTCCCTGLGWLVGQRLNRRKTVAGVFGVLGAALSLLPSAAATMSGGSELARSKIVVAAIGAVIGIVLSTIAVEWLEARQGD